MVTRSSRAAPAKKPARKPAAKTGPKAPKTRAVARQEATDLDVETADDGALCGLSVRSARFIDLYLSTLDAGSAYTESGFTAKSRYVAQVAASRLLNSVKGRAYLAKRAKAMFERAEGEQDRLMRTLTFAAFADPNELVAHRVGCCRYCWGKLNRWQFTAGEWEDALLKWEEKRAKAIEAEKPDPGEMDTKGGTGFLKSREPNPDCPECCGEGEARIVFKDTSTLSPAAQALYAGTERTRDGVKVNVHSQDRARELLARILKLTDDSTRVAVAVDYAEVEAKYGEVMRRAQERAAQIRRERFGERGLGMMPGDRGGEVIGPDGKPALGGRP